MTPDQILYASAAVLLWGAAARKLRLARTIQRAVVYARASGYMASEMYHGARARLDRWNECIEKARRES